MLSTLTSIYAPFAAMYAPRLSALLKDRKGISAVEYAVLAVGIVAVVAGAASLLGTAVSGVFSKVTSDL